MIVASAASAAGETVGVWYDVPCGSRSALTVPADTSVGAAGPSTATIPHSTCRGSTVGCEYALAIAIASSRTRSRITWQAAARRRMRIGGSDGSV